MADFQLTSIAFNYQKYIKAYPKKTKKSVKNAFEPVLKATEKSDTALSVPLGRLSQDESDDMSKYLPSYFDHV